jgi:hypothetical protein
MTEGGKKSPNEIAFDAIRPVVLAFSWRSPMTWQLSDAGVDTQLIVNEVLAAFAREGYELTPTANPAKSPG